MEDETQVFYNGKWHDKNHFRVWMYKANGERKLINNWWEYEVLRQGGIWTDEKPNIKKALKHKKKDKENANGS